MKEVSSLLNKHSPLARRGFLGAGATLAGMLALAGCTNGASTGLTSSPNVVGPTHTSSDMVRRLLELSTNNAFTRLSAPEGFWRSSVGRINMPVLFGRSGKDMPGVLRQSNFREQLQRRLNVIAEDGARAAAPQVAEAIRNLPLHNAVELLHGSATSGTSYLRAQVGPTLVNAMIPAMDHLLKAADDPVIGQAVAALKNVDLNDAGHALALGADNAIWFEIGAEEAMIRRDPNSSGDAMMIAAFAK